MTRGMASPKAIVDAIAPMLRNAKPRPVKTIDEAGNVVRVVTTIELQDSLLKRAGAEYSLHEDAAKLWCRNHPKCKSKLKKPTKSGLCGGCYRKKELPTCSGFNGPCPIGAILHRSTCSAKRRNGLPPLCRNCLNRKKLVATKPELQGYAKSSFTAFTAKRRSAISLAAKARLAAMSPRERSEMMRRANAAKTPDMRRRSALKAAATKRKAAKLLKT